MCPFMDAFERFLKDVLGPVGVVGHPSEVSEQSRTVTAKQLVQGPAVTIAVSIDQAFVGSVHQSSLSNCFLDNYNAPVVDTK